MRNIILPKIIRIVMMLVIVVAGSGGIGSGEATSAEVLSQSGRVSIIRSGSAFTIQGDGMDGVGGVRISLSYNSSELSSPSVTETSYSTGSLMAANTTVPGKIIVAIVRATPFSGSGQLATITFASQAEGAAVTIDSVEMYDVDGNQVQ
ncbi:cohesin domain-containing protein [Geobacter sp. DSM 9736]|uniref:cohesin domain-containing protein n=1 Tax=Geobacter sp. DSM 9736 TaxID=1277350 RepID=UPI000B5017EE|nr:cohesin domain-containing protein [Geobacter sp. DSM 9736]SNB44670.1 hypothetical protein SAMN06269301_0057 [Geobacter sp. DSM 9736]